MRWSGALLLCGALATIAPLLGGRESATNSVGVALPAWPHHFEGRPLMRIELNPREREFLSDFPGAVARFSDGQRDIVMRWVTQPTRRLHPAEDCYRGWGYEVGQSRIVKDRDNAQWRCFDASNAAGSREVCEQLRDTEGGHWTDVSSWYWAATVRSTQGPWLAITVARNR